MIASLFRAARPSGAVQPAAKPLVIVPVPALVDVLEQLEAAKGAPLTEADVRDARDRAVCVRVTAAEAAALVAGERFHIAPLTAWADWSAYRQARNVRPAPEEFRQAAE